MGLGVLVGRTRVAVGSGFGVGVAVGTGVLVGMGVSVGVGVGGVVDFSLTAIAWLESISI